MLPEAFEEFEVAYIFLATFCFLLSLSIGKRLTLGKIWRGGGGGGCSPRRFLRACASVYTTDTTCFDECFLFHVITGKH